MAVATLLFTLLLFPFHSAHCYVNNGSSITGNGGKWKVLKRSIGISAMHMSLLPNNKLIIFDRTDFGVSNISLPSGKCRNDTRDRALTHDCSAHSVEFDRRQVRPLTILTDTWCSSGALDLNGVLVQTGGFNDGDRVVRYFEPCNDGCSCDWTEDPNGMEFRRWYATNQVLHDGKTMVVVGGRRQFNYEFVPKQDQASALAFDLPFLQETRDPNVENNLYPFVHLSTDGYLFVFANTKSILLDYVQHRVVRTFPEMPGGASRNYPSSGSSVLLPLDLTGESLTSSVDVEVMICCGTPPESYLMVKKSHN